MKKLVNVVQNTRNEIWTDGKAKKLADDFEQKAQKVLTEWFHAEPSRAIAYNIFSFDVKAIALSDDTVLLEDAPITGWQERSDLEDSNQFVKISEDYFLQIRLDNYENYMPVKNIKPFIDELTNRGYKVLFNKCDDLLSVSFKMPKE